MTPESAMAILPPAPPYDGSVAPLPAGSRSVFAYKDERASRLVWCIKYKKSAHAASLGGYALHASLSGRLAPDDKPILIIPMPITERRRRERGYNQCELILREIERLDPEKRFRYERRLLVRVQHKDRQTLKGRKDRQKSAQGIFAVIPETAARVKNTLGSGCRVVVIDDVITTGSTMKEALDTLRAAGFESAWGLSLAH